MNRKVNNVIRIPSSLQGKNNNFFRYWMEFLLPFHKLTPREMDVAACFIKHRYNLSKVVSDNALLDKMSLSVETKKAVREELGLTVYHLQVVMRKLKNAKFIVNDRINPRFIPKNIEEGDKGFQLLLYFDFDETGIE